MQLFRSFFCVGVACVVMYCGDASASYEDRRTLRLLELAEAGDAVAALSLGRIYETGRGAKADGNLALHWYARAVDGGIGLGTLAAASLLAIGELVPRDYSRATQWLQRYAALGGPLPCVTIQNEASRADPATIAALCAVMHHWRSYAYLPRMEHGEQFPNPTGDNFIHVRLGLNLAKKTLVVVESNAPKALIKEAQDALMETLKRVPIPAAVGMLNEELVFEASHRLKRVSFDQVEIEPTHWKVPIPPFPKAKPSQ